VLAHEFDIAPRNVEITSGHSSKLKHVRVFGVTRSQVERLLIGRTESDCGATGVSRRRSV
jgi:uncharacterized protein YggU (UPF0235/DUF167 family)